MNTPLPPGALPLPRIAGLAITSFVLGLLAVTAFSIFTGIPALVLGLVALVKLRRAPGLRTGRAAAGAGLVLGGLSVAMLPFMPPLIMPDLRRVRTVADETACLHNVHLCAMACAQYAEDHGTALPKTWDEVQAYLGDVSFAQHNLHCPCAPDSTLSYELVPGRRLIELAHPEKIIVVREIHANHHGQRAVGYADGHVELQAGP